MRTMVREDTARARQQRQPAERGEEHEDHDVARSGECAARISHQSEMRRRARVRASHVWQVAINSRARTHARPMCACVRSHGVLVVDLAERKRSSSSSAACIFDVIITSAACAPSGAYRQHDDASSIRRRCAPPQRGADVQRRPPDDRTINKSVDLEISHGNVAVRAAVQLERIGFCVARAHDRLLFNLNYVPIIISKCPRHWCTTPPPTATSRRTICTRRRPTTISTPTSAVTRRRPQSRSRSLAANRRVRTRDRRRRSRSRRRRRADCRCRRTAAAVRCHLLPTAMSRRH